MWFGDLVDIKELPAADSKRKISIRVPFSDLGNSFLSIHTKFRLAYPKNDDFVNRF